MNRDESKELNSEGLTVPPKAAPCLACGKSGPEGFKKACTRKMIEFMNRGVDAPTEELGAEEEEPFKLPTEEPVEGAL